MLRAELLSAAARIGKVAGVRKGAARSLDWERNSGRVAVHAPIRSEGERKV